MPNAYSAAALRDPSGLSANPAASLPDTYGAAGMPYAVTWLPDTADPVSDADGAGLPHSAPRMPDTPGHLSHAGMSQPALPIGPHSVH